MPKKQSSDEISALAGKIMNMQTARSGPLVDSRLYDVLLHDAKRLAGSVLAQDEHKGLLGRIRKVIGS